MINEPLLTTTNHYEPLINHGLSPRPFRIDQPWGPLRGPREWMSFAAGVEAVVLCEASRGKERTWRKYKWYKEK